MRHKRTKSRRSREMEANGVVVQLHSKRPADERRYQNKADRACEVCAGLDQLYKDGKITAEEAMERRAMLRAMLSY